MVQYMRGSTNVYGSPIAVSLLRTVPHKSKCKSHHFASSGAALDSKLLISMIELVCIIIFN